MQIKIIVIEIIEHFYDREKHFVIGEIKNAKGTEVEGYNLSKDPRNTCQGKD